MLRDSKAIIPFLIPLFVILRRQSTSNHLLTQVEDNQHRVSYFDFPSICLVCLPSINFTCHETCFDLLIFGEKSGARLLGKQWVVSKEGAVSRIGAPLLGAVFERASGGCGNYNCSTLARLGLLQNVTQRQPSSSYGISLHGEDL
jgi:hypothetical protein